ncbi:hypothetical protein [Variovorax sp. J22R115]|uniref:hypothetical protein n=1 Tax=Variovorax sp. J22R115 TaxID=3053509 RepID=UPI00257700DA|nr:hypothetical protein [Variovorax sp. J22R115]MDM0052852.1 hypothetical protein [Variovorax sp. J22R115]
MVNKGVIAMTGGLQFGNVLLVSGNYQGGVGSKLLMGALLDEDFKARSRRRSPIGFSCAAMRAAPRWSTSLR